MDRASLASEIQAMRAVLDRVEFKYSEDQPRDEAGRWSAGGGGGAATAIPAGHENAAHDAIAQVPKSMGDPNADGSMAHPLYVDGDLDAAVKAINEGKHVRLDQPRQVVTLVDKLGDMAEDAVAKGGKAPTYNLGLITIPGTNLFTQQSLGIPRVEMPQLSGPPRPGSPADNEQNFPKNARGSVNLGEAFRDELEHQGFKVTDARVPAESLRATQMDLVGPQVAGMAQSLEQGKLNIRPIFVSKDDYVVDGHHQWAATVLANLRAGNTKFDIPVQRVDADIGTILDTSREYTEAMGIAQKAGTAKTIEAIKRVLAVQGPGQWVAMDPLLARVLKFREDEARDEAGRWTSDGGAAVAERPSHDQIKANLLKETTPVQTLKDWQKGFIGKDGTIYRFPASTAHENVATRVLQSRSLTGVTELAEQYGYQRVGVFSGSGMRPGDIALETHGSLSPEHHDTVERLLRDNPNHMLVWDHYTDPSHSTRQIANSADEYRDVLERMGQSKAITGYQFSERRLKQIRRWQIRVGGEDLLD